MGMLRRFSIPFQDADASGVLGGAPAGATVKFYRPGARTNNTIGDLADAAVDASGFTTDNPGSLQSGDTCYLVDESTGIDKDTSIAIGTVSFNRTTGEWTIPITNNSGKTVNIAENDRLILKTSGGGREAGVRIYSDEALESTPATTGVITLSSLGVAEGWLEDSDVDIVITDASGNMYEHEDIPSDRRMWVTPEEFGGVGDGTTDDTIAVQRACDMAGYHDWVVRFAPGKNYLITDRVWMWSDIDGRGSTITINDTNTNPLVFGMPNSTGISYLEHKWAFMPNIINSGYTPGDGWPDDESGLSIHNARFNHIVVPYVEQFIRGVELGNNLTTLNGEVRGNTIIIGEIENCKVGLRLYSYAGFDISGNTFIGGRIRHSTSETKPTTGAYKIQLACNSTGDIENNTFMGIDISSAAGNVVAQYSIHCEGNDNHFINCNWNAAADMYFDTAGSDGRRNVIMGGDGLINVSLTGSSSTSAGENLIIPNEIMGSPAKTVNASVVAGALNVQMGHKQLRVITSTDVQKINFHGAAPGQTAQGVIIYLYAAHASGCTLKHLFGTTSGDIREPVGGADLVLAQHDTAVLMCVYNGTYYEWTVISKTA